MVGGTPHRGDAGTPMVLPCRACHRQRHPDRMPAAPRCTRLRPGLVPARLRDRAGLPLAIRTRLYELSRVSTDWALRVWPHARDIHHGAALAARQMDLPAAARRAARVEDLSADASTLTWQGNTLEVPEACREVLHVARADKVADGFAPAVSLFQVRDTSLQRYVTTGR